MNVLVGIVLVVQCSILISQAVPQRRPVHQPTVSKKNESLHKAIASIAGNTNSVFVLNTSASEYQPPRTNINRHETPLKNVAPGIGYDVPKYPETWSTKDTRPFTPTYTQAPTDKRRGFRNSTVNVQGIDRTSTFFNNREQPRTFSPTRATDESGYGEPRILTQTTNPKDKNEPSTQGYHDHGLAPRVTTDPSVKLVTSHYSRKDLCGRCLCDPASQTIVCEHQHTIYEDDKHRLSLRRDSIPKSAVYIRVTGYDEVEIEPETFADSTLKLRLLIFEDIMNLKLKRHSLLFGSESESNVELVVQFNNCKIPIFPREALTQLENDSHGRQNRVKLQNTRFLSVEFVRCRIGVVEKKSMFAARVMYFNITDTEISSIKENAIDLDVYELCKIMTCKLPTLVPKALCFHSKKTVFSSNLMKDIMNHSIVVETDGQVLFEYNRVERLHSGALTGIMPMPNVYGASIVFLMNSVEIAEPFSLYINKGFPAHEVKVLNNSFHIECSCNISSEFEIIMNVSLSSSNDETTYRNVIENSQCLEAESKKFIVVNKYLMNECVPFPIVTVGAIIAAIVLFIISITVCVVCSLRVQQFKEEANVLGECTSQSFSTLSRADLEEQFKFPSACQSPCQTPLWNMTQWVAAVPEVKTYQQTTVQDFNEQAESICGTIRGSSRASTIPVEGRILARGSCPCN